MAKFNSNIGFNIQKINLNWFFDHYEGEELLRGINQTIEGAVYRDVLVVNGFDDKAAFWSDYYLSFAGNGIAGSANRNTVSGTVNVMAESYADEDGNLYGLWGLTGFALSAQTINRAAKSNSNADDIALFRTALNGADRITLSQFDDNMTGFAGSDTIYGYGGEDSISGGTGADHLYGGTGPDNFVFDDGETGLGAARRDVIYDFRRNSDDIDLRLVDANTKLRGDQKFDFSVTTPTKNAVWFVASSTGVIVYGDTNGDRRADFEIDVRGVTFLTASDFAL
jgi:Ca2+-binding RTX toxin-like protein